MPAWGYCVVSTRLVILVISRGGPVGVRISIAIRSITGRKIAWGYVGRVCGHRRLDVAVSVCNVTGVCVGAPQVGVAIAVGVIARSTASCQRRGAEQDQK